MPFVSVTIAGANLRPVQIQEIQKEVTRLMANDLNKQADLTSVLISQVPVAGWSVGGEPLVVGAHLDAKVTAGTNSAEEKARFISDAHALLKDVVGPHLPLATYVVVDEVPSESWGYGGLTQAHRAAARRA